MVSKIFCANTLTPLLYHYPSYETGHIKSFAWTILKLSISPLIALTLVVH